MSTVRIQSVRIANYGPFAHPDAVRLGPLATIIGQNDAGKSHLLHALQVFFGAARLSAADVHHAAQPEEPVCIEVALSGLAPVALEESAPTTLRDELLTDADGCLRIRKTWWPASSLEKPEIALITHDFADERFAGLFALKAKELAERLRTLAPARARSPKHSMARSATEQRAALRLAARAAGIQQSERIVTVGGARDALWKLLEPLLPRFELFEAETRLGVGETTFQSQFRPMIRAAAEDARVVVARQVFTETIGAALQNEVDEIFEHLQRHTGLLAGLSASPSFSWEKAVTFDIVGRDQSGIEQSLDQRGSGMRRLLMVAFFQYLADRRHGAESNVIYAVEEPENCLHPGLQRELAASFQRLADEGAQVILTSHSPVFAGASPIPDLVLVERRDGAARATQSPDPAHVAEQLGVEPADSITGYSACVFVEGMHDVRFWRAIARKLKAGGHVAADFDDRRIGLMPSAGQNLKQWITLRALHRLNRRFAAIVDSDRTCPSDPPPAAHLRWQRDCESHGGRFFMLRKREIENYLHPAALARAGFPGLVYDDYSDVKALCDDKTISRVIEDMSCDELLAMDRYAGDGVTGGIADGAERHELLEILVALLALPGGRKRSPARTATARHEAAAAPAEAAAAPARPARVRRR